jgi:hypothetical protein
MKESFDPLAEAQRRSDPQLVRYNETIGHDPDTNADYAAYLRGRDFVDANGNIHDAKTSKFKKRGTETDPYEADLINSAHAEALEENALRDSSLDALAKKVAEARQHGDTEAAKHAEDLFFDKFTSLSEKYGWEEDDDSVNDTLRVDKDAKVGRSTIDDRLARYSKIMYGEDTVEQRVPAEKPAAEASATEEKAAETSTKEEATQAEAEPADAEPAAAKPETFDIDAETEQAKERLSKRAEALEQQANAQRADSESAKADRELLARVSKEGLDDLDEAAPIAKVSKEGLEADDSEPGKISRVSKEGLDSLDEMLEDDEVEPSKPAKNFLGRARKALDKARNLYLRAAFEVGHTVDLAKQELSKRGGRKEGETEEQYERRMRRNGRNIALGIVALAGASIAAKAGAFDSIFDGGHPLGTPPADAADTARGGRQGGGREVIDAPVYSAEARRVDNGEGLFQTFKDMGIPKDKWQSVLDQSGPKLVRMGEAYNDPSIGGYGLNGDGRLSQRALNVIADSARNVK